MNQNNDIEEEEFEVIERDYYYGGKQEHTSVIFFPNKNIATITTIPDDSKKALEAEIISEGMTRKELELYFSPDELRRRQGKTYDRKKIIRSIIYESYIKEGTSLEVGNVRNFWYTHLKSVITTKLGLRENPSVATTVNDAWGDVINSALVTYEGMNIVGGKEYSRISIVKDSPFSNLIIAVEKMDFFEMFKWIPKLFNCTLITAGGQSARTSTRAFIYQLKNLGIDLNQKFYMCVASDLDPAGYYIQEGFKKQLEGAIHDYGGTGKIEIKRLFVRKDQVSKTLLQSEAMPCKDSAKSVKAMKAEDTKWKHFCTITDGGIYIDKPDDWEEYEIFIGGDGKKKVRGDGVVYNIENEEKVRALLEMNAFPKRVIEKAITNELLKTIHETNDESKIMIPEIMRIFELMREETVEDIYKIWHEKLIEPLINKFLSETKRWEYDISNKYWDEIRGAKDSRDEQYKPIDNKYIDLIHEKEEEAEERVPDLYDKQGIFERAIEKLQEKLEAVQDDINEQCSDIFEEIEQLEKDREEEKKPIKEEFDEKIEEIELKKQYRNDKKEQFEEENKTIFNPIEMALKDDITQALSKEEIDYFFKQIEKMEQFKPHISRLLTEPTFLTEEEISCFKQDTPTFNEEDLLIKSSQKHHENIEKVRKAFSNPFLNEMKKLFESHIIDVEFETTGEVEEQDLYDDVTNSMKKTEDEIEKGLWKPEEEEDDEGE